MATTKTSAKVSAVNNANQYALALFDVLQPVFKQYEGRKVVKADGNLVSALATEVCKSLESWSPTSCLVFKKHSNYHLVWCVKVSQHVYEPSGSIVFTLHYERECILGSLVDGVLTKVYVQLTGDRRTNYTVEEVREKQNNLIEIRKQYDEVYSKLYPFAEND